MNKIQKTLAQGLALAAITAALATSARADQKMVLSQDTAHYSVDVGGAFIATVVSGPMNLSSYSSLAENANGTGFLTFCVEYNEEFVPGGTYNYGLSNGAVKGGVSGQTSSNYDGLSNASAWLYSQFAQGLLHTDYASAFNYNLTGFGVLQQAIWFLEGEVGSVTGSALSLVNSAKSHEGANWNSDNNGAYGVQVINMTYLDGGVSQDQLYYHAVSQVPDQGATVALLGLSLLGIAGFRRKFKAAK